MNENKLEKLLPAGADSAKPKVPSEVLPVLPDLPLPVIQANYRPLPPLDLISQPKRRAFSSPRKRKKLDHGTKNEF